MRGPDGNLWFTETGTGKIGRLSPNSFSVTGEFPTLTPNSAPVGITVGQDGALWFTENGQDKVGRITTGGTVTEFASPVTGLGLRGIGGRTGRFAVVLRARHGAEPRPHRKAGVLRCARRERVRR